MDLVLQKIAMKCIEGGDFPCRSVEVHPLKRGAHRPSSVAERAQRQIKGWMELS